MSGWTAIPRPATLTWAVLVVATLVSLRVGTDDDLGRDATGIVVLAIGFCKAWLVLRNFVELREAPPRLRAALTLYLAALYLLLVVVLVTR
jgi:hypothetical protein